MDLPKLTSIDVGDSAFAWCFSHSEESLPKHRMRNRLAESEDVWRQ